MHDYSKVNSYSKEQQLRGHQKPPKEPKLVNKRPLNSQKQGPKKKTKRVRRENRIPSMKTRKKFTPTVIEQAMENFNGLCANCGMRAPDDPHHIRFKSDEGKGVLSNCLPVCRSCHEEIHRDPELAMYWKDWAKEKYGFDYWMDAYDKEKAYEPAHRTDEIR